MVRRALIKTYSNLQPVILGCHRRSPNLRHTLVHFRGFLRAAHSAKCFRLARQQANQHRTACSVLLLKHDQQALVARCGLRGLIPVIVQAAQSREGGRHPDIVLSIKRFVDPYGRVLQSSEMFQSAVLTEDVRFLKVRTVYSRIGDTVGWLSVAFVAAALLATLGKVK